MILSIFIFPHRNLTVKRGPPRHPLPPLLDVRGLWATACTGVRGARRGGGWTVDTRVCDVPDTQSISSLAAGAQPAARGAAVSPGEGASGCSAQSAGLALRAGPGTLRAFT